ncbi:hypothetical protein LH464_22455 [Neorhizobium sp. T786]|uniref:hypothetical protein n=1 Tax=Pseudorhizobium xiangyangii TaxID=2883104 RepID=UPI001CFFC1F6|nr:hypothetical protein [Neorhizobium xiangyangii]MCB5205233.1 hypothetical protein [Neorhizobium xiangyangii]
MTQTLSKSRQQAEIAFTKSQSQFFARGKAVEEQVFAAQAREANKAPLRARMAVETDHRKRGTLTLTKSLPRWPEIAMSGIPIMISSDSTV